MGLQEYDEKCEKIQGLFEQFNEMASGGREGRGSKTRALKARKLSMEITNELKDFRSESIANDKAK